MADAWWVYCVVPGDRDVPTGLDGVAGGEPVPIQAGSLRAVASRVPLSEYGEEPLRENLNDLAWLERMARGHEAVLEQMLRGGAVVPLSVCTICSSEAQVAAMLEERADVLRDALARLACRSEWGVKAVVDRARLEQHAVTSSDETRALAAEVAAKSAGAAYIARKRLAARVRDEAERVVCAIVRDGHERLEGWATASRVLPAQSRELSGHEGEMVFNAAYLVDDDRVHPFASLVRELDREYEGHGFTFELTGPWPAYNFVGRLTEPAEVLG